MVLGFFWGGVGGLGGVGGYFLVNKNIMHMKERPMQFLNYFSYIYKYPHTHHKKKYSLGIQMLEGHTLVIFYFLVNFSVAVVVQAIPRSL